MCLKIGDPDFDPVELRSSVMICGCLSSLPFFLATDRFHLGLPKRFLRLEIFVDKTRLPVIVKKNLVMANATSSRQILFNMQ